MAALPAAGAAAVLLAGCTAGSVPAAQPSDSVVTTPAAVTSLAPTGGATPTVSQTSAGRSSSVPPAPESTAAGTSSAAAENVPVQITISAWDAKSGQARVDAFVPGRVIRGGTCTLTMTHDGTTRRAHHDAIATPDATSCGLITIPGSRLTAGSWRAVVTFAAPNVSGMSHPVTITVRA